MNIREKVDLVKSIKGEIKTSIENKGVTVGSNPLSAYPSLISDITTGIDTGDATAVSGDILSGKTAYARGSKLNGAMPNVGAIGPVLTRQNQSITVNRGYHNGNGRVTTNISNLVPANVKSGVNVGGIVGTHQGGLKVKSGSVNGNTHSFRLSSDTSRLFTLSVNVNMVDVNDIIGVILNKVRFEVSHMDQDFYGPLSIMYEPTLSRGAILGYFRLTELDIERVGVTSNGYNITCRAYNHYSRAVDFTIKVDNGEESLLIYE